MTTATDVARWMLAELERRGGRLPEAEAASFIERTFGPEFASRKFGAPSVNTSVVDALFQSSAGTVHWSPGDRVWYYPDAADYPDTAEHDSPRGSRLV